MARTVLCVLTLAVWPRVADAAPPTDETPRRDRSAESEQPPAIPSEQPPSEQPRLPEGFEPAVLLQPAQVTYPAGLASSSPAPAGAVELRYVVGVDGVPAEIEIVTPLHPELDAIARDAVAALRYEPARFEGEPVEVVLAIRIVFEPPAREADTSLPDSTDSADDTVSTNVETNGDVDATATTDGPGAPPPVPPPGPAEVVGRLLAAGERSPIVGASVIVVPARDGDSPGRVRGTTYDDVEPAWLVATQTDEEGRFRLERLPEGLVRVVVIHQGFERTVTVAKTKPSTSDGRDAKSPGASKTRGAEGLVIFAKPSTDSRFKTSVTVARESGMTERTISVTEINALPGTQGDALKSLQNFPGVARPPIGVGLLVIRGSAPSDSRTLLAHHEIPQLFHFGALTSVFNSDALAQIDFIPGNFDARYGDAIGGIVAVQPRKGRRDGWHGYVDADLFDAGVFVEGPVGKGSVIMSLRRSYVDGILKVALPKDAGLDFDTAPRYWDYQGLFDYPVAGGNLSVRVFGSDDQLRVVSEAPNDEDPDEGDQFGTQIAFHRVDLAWEREKDGWRFLITPSYRHDIFTGAAAASFDFDFTVDEFSWRAEIGRRVSKNFGITAGTDMTAGTYTIDAIAPAIPAPGTGFDDAKQAARLRGSFAQPGLFATGTIRLGQRVTLLPGVRFTQRAVVFKRFSTEPRLRLSIEASPTTTVKAGVGMYVQSPDVFEFNAVWGNPRIGLERAVHSSVGVAQLFPNRNLSIELVGFHKYMYDLATISRRLVADDAGNPRPETFANAGDAHVFGAELLVRRDLARNLFGWLSYTASRALYRERPGTPRYPFQFDQPHILTALLVYQLPRRWQIGARFRLVSGNPYTPVDDCVWDASNATCIPLEGATNSARLRTFHQLDIRLDKTWAFRLVTLTAYLDLQNTYNRRNPEALLYSWDYHDSSVVAGLPILPSLGLRLNW